MVFNEKLPKLQAKEAEGGANLNRRGSVLRSNPPCFVRWCDHVKQTACERGEGRGLFGAIQVGVTLGRQQAAKQDPCSCRSAAAKLFNPSDRSR